MSWQDFLTAICIFLIFEGTFPLVMPDTWREFMKGVTKQSNGSLRTMGLTSVIIGVVLLYAFR